MSLGIAFKGPEGIVLATDSHGEAYVDDAHRHMIDTGGFAEAFCQTHVMKWPGDDTKEAQEHFDEMADEISDRLFEETRPVIVEAFVRIASDVTLRERRRR